jgi:Domain of unknown function (DUF1833)
VSSFPVFPPVLNVLSLAAQADKGKLASGDAWLMLCEVIWNGQYIRVVRNTDSVTFDAGDGLGPQTYQPFNFDLVIERNGNGQLPSIQLKCSNVMGLMEGLIQEYAGAVGAVCNLYFVNTANPSGEGCIALSTTILQTNPTDATVNFTLGAPKPQLALFPRFMYRADFCMWPYKSEWCGYTGDLPNCDLTYNGADGCVAHGNQQRFGAFPGIGTNGASVASQT